MTRRERARLVVAIALALVPPSWKPYLYRRLCGYEIGERVRIGVSILFVDRLVLADDVHIGHGNVAWRTGELVVGEHARLGHLNVIRGGRQVTIGRYADILRRNELNAILDPLTDNEVDSRLSIGDGAVITDGHKVDFTDRVEIGRRAIVGGRSSSLWTHNRQATAPINIGDLVYLGSEVRIGPGASVPRVSIVGMGSVVVSRLADERTLYGGVPAKAIRPLGEEDLERLCRPTRVDLPADL
jgi:acetyltransferase-like isoleucine patch superfamily enzyme